MNSIIARLIAGTVAQAVISWARPFLRDELVANGDAITDAIAKLTDAATLNAAIVRASAKLPPAITIRLLGRHLTVPVASVLTADHLALLFLVVAGKESDALARARAALTAAYATALAKA